MSSRARPAGKRLQDELGIRCVPDADSAVDGADVVILAVPDTLIGKLAARPVAQLPAGTMVMTLDAAAPFAGHLPQRPDLVYFVAHPCHPTIFSPEVHTPGATDYFGGATAPQSITSALMQGPDERLRPGRGHRQDHLPAHPALLPADGGADGAAGAGPVGDGVRHAAGRDARGHGRGGGRAACRPTARATSCWAT
jgi:hypothetical protein